MPKVSVLLPHYHESAQPFLDVCLKSLEAQTFQDFELIVTSSNHQPKLSKRVDKQHHSSSRLHFPAAIKKAYELSDSSSEFLLLLNDDCIMSDTCLTELIGTYNSLQMDVILGPRSNCGPIMGFYHTITGVHFNGQISHVGTQFRQHDLEGNESLFIHRQVQYPSGVFKVPFSAFFCTLIKRSVYDRVGGINPEYKTGKDDLDFAVRAAKLGISCFVSLSASCLHASGVTADVALTKEDRDFNEDLFNQENLK